MQYNFLELVQMVARESGTIPDSLPQTVNGQSGRIGKIVQWVNLAWRQIQNLHASWRWMHAEFDGEISPGMYRYASTQMGLHRFARWSDLPHTMSIYESALGRQDEGFIWSIDDKSFKRLYEIGEQEPGRPSRYCISQSNLLMFGPVPDKIYTVRGEYYRSAQELVADNDVPELPERFRPIIGWLALVLLSKHDEAGFAVGAAAQSFQEYLGKLEMDQLPNFRVFRRLF